MVLVSEMDWGRQMESLRDQPTVLQMEEKTVQVKALDWVTVWDPLTEQQMATGLAIA